MSLALILDNSNQSPVDFEAQGLAVVEYTAPSPLSAEEILQKRLLDISEIASTAMDQMNLSDLRKDLVIQFDFDKITPNPKVGRVGSQIRLHIPLLMLFRPEDFKANSPLFSFF